MEKTLKVLFLSQVEIKSIADRSIYSDLISEFIDHGHQVTVVSAVERRNKLKIQNPKEFELYRVITPNLQKTSKVEKAVGHLLFDYQLLAVIKRKLKDRHFDICLYFSPPITITSTLSYVKKKYNTFNYLWLKDIFPQNALDMAFMKSHSAIYKYFRKVELKYYSLSDKIGVMSPANLDYLITHSDGTVSREKVEVCPNCVKIIEEQRSKVFVNKESVKRTFFYGGNLGVPQDIDFLMKILDHFKNNENYTFEIVGSGTEYSKLSKWIDEHKFKNISLTPFLPNAQYLEKLVNADVGLILLNPRFTIPNFPSRLLSYLLLSKPVLCFTDKITDIGPIAKSNNFGDWALSDDLSAAVHLIENYARLSSEELVQKGSNGYQFLKDNYTSDIAYNIIIKSYNHWLEKNNFS